jgi:acetyl-CoA C-acetyltransferase
MTEAVIVSAARTAVGAFNGVFANVPASILGEAAIRAALQRADVDAGEVDEAIMGQVLTGAQGQNPARQAALAAGLSVTSTALTINQVCGSGLRAVCLAAQAIKAGDADIIVAGGQESMSQSVHAVHLRAGIKMGPSEMIDTMIKDGLWDAFNNYHMGVTAENIAKKWAITRTDQDAFAFASQQKAAAASAAGRFQAEIIPVMVKARKAEVEIACDEYPKPETTREILAKLRPAFAKDGTVTAGNASGINDGAAALVIMSAAEAAKRAITPLARIVAFATAGVDPAEMGMGPVPATQKVLAKAGWSRDDLDLIEANEAFAAQALAVIRELGVDPAKVNINGGAIALGHPIGASGARILVTLLHAMLHRQAKRGLATLCIGGGMGITMAVERP